MKKILKRIVIAFVLFIVAINGIFYAIVPPFMDVWDEGKIVVLGKYAFVFAHGGWVEEWYGKRERIVGHITNLGYDEVYTDELLDSLIFKEGCKYIWISMCHSGENDFISYDRITGESKPWPKEVSRPGPGNVLPLFLGWFFRWTNEKPQKFSVKLVVPPDSINISIFPEILEIKEGGDLRLHINDIKNDVKIWTEMDMFNCFRLDSISIDDYKYVVQKIDYEKCKKFSSEKMREEVKKNTVLKRGKLWKRGKSFYFTVTIQPVTVW